MVIPVLTIIDLRHQCALQEPFRCEAVDRPVLGIQDHVLLIAFNTLRQRLTNQTQTHTLLSVGIVEVPTPFTTGQHAQHMVQFASIVGNQITGRTFEGPNVDTISARRGWTDYRFGTPQLVKSLSKRHFQHNVHKVQNYDYTDPELRVDGVEHFALESIQVQTINPGEGITRDEVFAHIQPMPPIQK